MAHFSPLFYIQIVFHNLIIPLLLQLQLQHAPAEYVSVSIANYYFTLDINVFYPPTLSHFERQEEGGGGGETCYD